MGLFDKWKKDTSKSSAQVNKAQNSNVVSYENAIVLLNSDDIEDEFKGRQMMTSLAWGSGKSDPRVCLWMAKEYEENSCPSAAADWYLKAYNCGATEAEADYKRCYNPFHIDEYYAIDGERGSGTPHLRYSEEMQAKQKAAFDECIQKLKSNPSREEIDQCIEIMNQLASAQRGYPHAMQWMAEYYSMVLHESDTSNKWYTKAAKAGRSMKDFAYDLLDANIVERLGGNQKENDKKTLYSHYSAVAEKNGLLKENKAVFVRDVFQPKPFCEKAFDYCSMRYAGIDARKLCFEYCMTAFYGAACTVALWQKDSDFNTDSTWDSLHEKSIVDSLDANAEKLLGTEQGEEKAESIFAIIHEYIKLATPVLLPYENEREMMLYAMEYAYRLGLLLAQKELGINMDYPVSEVILGLENKTKDKTEGTSSRKLDSTGTFYARCTFGFEKAAIASGVSRGLKFIPELLPYGEKTILAFLRDSFFRDECGVDKKSYYYLIMSLSIEAGLVYAAKWHEDVAGLPAYVNKIIEVGPADDANELLKRYFSDNVSADQGNPFFQKIFSLLMEYHEPYWELEDPREYTFVAMLAAYRLGVSMMLDKLDH